MLPLDSEKQKVANEYAWKWFSFHADQRMKVFSFFLVATGVLTAAFYQTYNRPLIALTFAVLGVIFSFVFWRLDLRTRELIKIGEDLLLELEGGMNDWGIANVHLVGKANSKKTKHSAKYPNFIYSYGQVFSAVFALTGLVSFLGALILLVRMYCGIT